MRVTLTNAQGETQKLTVTIEGNAGKVTLYARMDDHPDQTIRLIADKFEEKM